MEYQTNEKKGKKWGGETGVFQRRGGRYIPLKSSYSNNNDFISIALFHVKHCQLR